jgi:DUF1680 family protein
MFLKIMGALPSYVYAQNEHAVAVNLFVGSQARLLVHGQPVALHQTTRYPWEDAVRIAVDPAQEVEFALDIRIPGWCQGTSVETDLYRPLGRPESGAFRVQVNGAPVRDYAGQNGYARLHRVWRRGDIVDITMDMPARRVTAHPQVAAAQGRVAITRGPLVYALETLDGDLRAHNVFLPPDASLAAEYRPDLLGGVCVIRGEFQAHFADEPHVRAASLAAIPYFCYGNRGHGDLRVWIPETQELATR